MIGLLTPHNMGWLLSLLSSIRLALKKLVRDQQPSLFSLNIGDKEKMFSNTDTRPQAGIWRLQSTF
jgi:hypothetical protein